MDCKIGTIIESYGATPTDNQVNFQKDELTAFIHFGINTFTDREWGDGTEKSEVFNPTDLDADEWVSILKDAGFKKVILTAKHHEGFSLWNTAHSDFDVSSSHWKNGKGDVVKEVSMACEKYRVKMGIYLSPWDQNSKDYGEGNGGDYNEYYMNQIKELLTNYGEISEFWMDGAKGSNVKQEYKFQEWFDLIYKLQPSCVIFSPEGPDVRWIGNENGYAGETCWSTISRDKMREREIPSYLNIGEENGPEWIVGESDVSIRPGWYYHEKEDNSVKSLEKLMDIYYKSVGRNSILLLNVPPNKSGKLHGNDIERIKEFGNAIRETFNVDIALNKNVVVSSIVDNNRDFDGNKIVDNNYDTYWSPNNNETCGSIEIDLGGENEFDVISIQEYIPLGQRIKSFDVEVMKNGEWKSILKGTTVGYKKYIRIAPIVASKIRINIIESLATPLINKVGVYKQPKNVELPQEDVKQFNDKKGIFEFEKVDYIVKRNIGTAKFKVIRKGEISGKSEVNYDTVAGSAINGEDYVRWSGTVAFNKGEVEKTFNITIIDSGVLGKKKSFFLELSDPIGEGILGSKIKAKVNIENY